MSGNVVPTTGNIYLRTAPSSTNKAIFEVFGTPAGNNLNGLRGTVYDDPNVRPPPLTTDIPLTVPASGNVSMALFRGKSKFMTTPSVPLISSLSSASLTPTLTGGSGTYYIAVGTTAGASDTTGGWKAATSGTAITTKQNGTTALSFAYATPYYISVYDSNMTTTTASRTLPNSTVYGIPNAATNVTLTLYSLTSWTINWSLSTGTVLPTGYSWYLLGGTVTYSGTVTSTTNSTSQSSTLDQNTNYYAQVIATRPEATTAQNSTAKSLNSPSTISAVTATLVAGTAGSASYTPSITGGGGGTLYIGFGTVATTPTIQWSSGAVTPSIAITAGTSYYVSTFSSNTSTGTRTSTGFSDALTIPVAPTFTTYSITDTTFNAVATSTSGATISYTISPVPSGGTATKSTGTWTGLTVNTQYTVTATATMTMTTTTTGSAVWCLAPPVVGNPIINLQSMSYPFTVSTNATGAVISNVFGAQAAVVTPAVVTRAASTTATTYASNTLVKYVIIATGPNTTYTSTVQYFCIVDPTTKATVTMPPSITSFTYYLVGGTGGIGVNSSGSKRYGGGSYGATLYGTTASASYGGNSLTLLTGTNGGDGRVDKSLTEHAICGDGYSGGNGGYGVTVYAGQGGEGGGSGSGGAASMILCSSPNLMIVAGGGGGAGAGYNQSGGGGWAGTTMPNPSPGGGGTSYYNNYYDSSGGGSSTTTYGGQGGVNGTGGASGSNMPGTGYPGYSGSDMPSTVTSLTSTSGDGGTANGTNHGQGTIGGGGGGGYGGGGAGANRNTGTYIESGGGGGGASYISDNSGTITYGGVVPVIIVYGTI